MHRHLILAVLLLLSMSVILISEHKIHTNTSSSDSAHRAGSASDPDGLTLVPLPPFKHKYPYTTSASTSTSLSTSSSTFPYTLSSYPIPNVSIGTCADMNYGNQFLKKWKPNRAELCDHKSTTSTTSVSMSLSSLLALSLTVQYYSPSESQGSKTHGEGDFFVSLSNVFYDPAAPSSSSSSSFSSYGSHKFTMVCQPSNTLFLNGDDHHQNDDGSSIIRPNQNHEIFQLLLRSLNIRHPDELRNNIRNNKEMDILVDHTPILLVDRHCDTPFQCSADLVSAYMIAHMLSIEFSRLRILFLDDDKDGNDSTYSSAAAGVMPVWRAIGGGGVYTRDEWSSHPLSPFDTPRLFTHVIMNIPTRSNFLCKDEWMQDVCKNRAPILIGFNQLASHAFQHHRHSHQSISSSPPPSSFSLSNRRHILLWSRKNVKDHRIANEDALVSSIRQSLPNWDVEAVDLDAYELSTLVAFANNASVVIGIHEEALALMLFVENVAQKALVELVSNKHHHTRTYENMALRLGIRYESWVNPNPLKNTDSDTIVVDTDAVAKIVHQIATGSSKTGSNQFWIN